MTQQAQPFYFMVVFWGTVYRGFFTDLLLASLLAPRNIPSLRRHPQHRFLIATTAEDWNALQRHENFERLRMYVAPIWFEMSPPSADDPRMLVMSKAHGEMATRAFQDRAYGVFLSPEMVFADGAVSALQKLAERGKKLVLCVAIRYCTEAVIPELERGGYLKRGQPLVIQPRELMRIGLANLHSETLRYEFDSPWFAEGPVSVYWWVTRGTGMIIHSFSWAGLVVDYGAMTRHDTRTFEDWTVDADYFYRNFPDPRDVYVVRDSDEIAMITLTREADLHFTLEPRLARYASLVVRQYKVRAIRNLRDSNVMDPLKRAIFPSPVYLHADDLDSRWSHKEKAVSRVIAAASRPPNRRERVAEVVMSIRARRLAMNLPPLVWGRRLWWAWRYRRFMWRRVKERLGILRGRSRVTDGQDWTSPALGVMNPLWSLRILAARFARRRWKRVALVAAEGNSRTTRRGE